MGERVIVFLLSAAAALVFGTQDWKRAPVKIRIAFVLILLYAGYTGYGYISDKPQPNLPDAVSLAFGDMAKRIDSYLKPQSLKEPSKDKGENAGE